MGVYNYYEGVQLKVEDQENLILKEYFIGDAVPLPDGIYIGHEGVVVVLNGKLIAYFKEMVSKWGNIIFPHDVL